MDSDVTMELLNAVAVIVVCAASLRRSSMYWLYFIHFTNSLEQQLFFGQIKCIHNRYQATFKWFMHLPPSSRGACW